MEKEHNYKHALKEKDRIGKISQIRELVFGAQDGLLVPLGVISSVAGAFNNNHIVIVAGISEALAGAFSMATGAYLSSQAERQVHIFEMEKERDAIKKYPEDERKEMILMFEKEDLSNEDATEIVNRLQKSETSFFNTMVQKELGLEPEPPGTPVKDAFFVGGSYLVSAMVPLFPYFFLTGTPALLLSIGCTLLALFIIGASKAKVAALPLFKSGLQVLFIGLASGIGGYIIGNYLPHLLGI